MSTFSKSLICSIDCKRLTTFSDYNHFIVVMQIRIRFTLEVGIPKTILFVDCATFDVLMLPSSLYWMYVNVCISCTYATFAHVFVCLFVWKPWRPFWHLLPPWGMFLTGMICCGFRGALFVCGISHGWYGLWLPLEPYSSHSCRSVWASSLCNPLQN